MTFPAVAELHKARFAFDSFIFIDNGIAVYLHCQVFMCHKQSTDARCTPSCLPNRAKRAIQGEESSDVPQQITELVTGNSAVVKSVERREVKQVYKPSKLYSMSLGPLIKEETNKEKTSKMYIHIYLML